MDTNPNTKNHIDHISALFSRAQLSPVATADIFNQTTAILDGYVTDGNIHPHLTQAAIALRQFAAARLIHALLPEAHTAVFRVSVERSSIDEAPTATLSVLLLDSHETALDWNREDVLEHAAHQQVYQVLRATFIHPVLVGFLSHLTEEHAQSNHAPTIPIASLVADDNFCAESRDDLIAYAFSLG